MLLGGLCLLLGGLCLLLGGFAAVVMPKGTTVPRDATGRVVVGDRPRVASTVILHTNPLEYS